MVCHFTVDLSDSEEESVVMISSDDVDHSKAR